MPKNGGKVGWQTLHDEILKQSDERHEMELRLIDAFGQGLAGIREDMATERKECNGKFLTLQTDVVNLKVADRKWAGLTGLVAATIAGVGAWLGQK